MLAVILPFAGLIVAIAVLWGWGFGWLELGLLLTMYVLTILGVTIGFHRLFTHKAFETSRSVKAVLAVLGSMAVEGPLLKWAALHRRHHQHSDKDEDPHSPHLHGEGIRGLFKGLWHAHVGWLFLPDAPGLASYIPDLLSDRLLRRISRLFAVWVAVGLLMPAIIGGLLTLTWSGALLGFLWGGLTRVFLVHHVTWSINSVCHLWGSQPFRSHDHSRNNFVFGVLALGEGWHNNHHAFPTSARHGLKWWQIDLSYAIIQGMALLGLAWKIRVPAAQAIEAKRKQ